MEFNPLAKHQRDFGRVAEIMKALVRYGLADWMRPLPFAGLQQFFTSREGDIIADAPMSVRVRLVLTELGPTFIKLGQVLSTRPDLVGVEFAEELSKLQSSTPPDAPEAIRDIIIADLGKPPEELFAEYEPVAFASASIAQVHRARLITGEPVVLKVRKPGIERKVEADLSILAWLADLAETHAPQLKQFEPSAVVRQFERTLLHELDFTHERRNMEEFTRRFAGDPTVRFPQAWPQYSGKHVLTMERLEGIQGNERDLLRDSGADMNAFALRGANMYLSMIFRDSFYHADPHPGNLMLLPGGVVGVLDCGMTGRLDERLRDEIENLVLAVGQSDALALTDAVCRLGSVSPGGDHDQLIAELSEFVADYAGQSISDLDLRDALNDLTGIIRRHHVVLPAGVSLLLRTLVLLEGTAQLLSPKFSLAEVIQPFYRRAIRRRFAPKRMFLRFQRTFRDWDLLFQALPRDLADALQRLRTGNFQVHLDHRHLDHVVNRLVMGIIMASVFLGSSLLWSMKAPPVLWDVSIFGATGYMIAVYLGWRIYRAIRKSGSVDSQDP
jgi:ubiquinone biosynthesis protein